MSSLTNRNDILKQNSFYPHSALRFWIGFCLEHFPEKRLDTDSREVYDILRDEFADKNSEEDLTMPFLFSFIDSQQRELEALQKKSAEFELLAKKRRKVLLKHKKRADELEKEIARLKGKE